MSYWRVKHQPHNDRSSWVDYESNITGVYGKPYGRRDQATSTKRYARRRWHNRNARRKTVACYCGHRHNSQNVNCPRTGTWRVRNGDYNRYQVRKQEGTRNRKRQRAVWRKKAQPTSLDHLVADVKQPWNQDRRYQSVRRDGCLCRDHHNSHYMGCPLNNVHRERHYDTSPITWEAKVYDDRFNSKSTAGIDLEENEQLPYLLTENELKYFKTIFGPNFDNGKAPHDHALGACVRYHAQRVLEQEHLQNKVRIDMWGSARLPSGMKWSVMPKITGHDYIRKRPERSCECDPVVCTHKPIFGVPFIVDVLYYLDVYKVHQICLEHGELWSLHHSFKTVFGCELDDTYLWYNDGENLHCKIGRGNAKHTYVHPNLNWLRKKEWSIGDHVLSYELKSTHGPMECGVFRLLPRSQAMEFESKYVDETCQKDNLLLDAAFYKIAHDFMRGKLPGNKVEAALISRLKRAQLEKPFSEYSKFFPEAWSKHFTDVQLAVLIDRTENDRTSALIQENAEEIKRSNGNYHNRYITSSDKYMGVALFGAKYAWEGALAVAKIFGNRSVGKGSSVEEQVGRLILTGISKAANKTHGGIQSLMTSDPMAFFGNVFRPDICVYSDFDNTNVVPPMREPELLNPRTSMGYSNYISKVPWKRVLIDGVQYLKAPSINLNFDRECGCNDPLYRRRGVLALSWVQGHEPYSFAGCENNIWYGLRMRFMRDLPKIDVDEWIALESNLDHVVALIKERSPRLSRKSYFNSWVKRFPLNKRNKMAEQRDLGVKVLHGDFAATVCCKWEVGLRGDSIDDCGCFYAVFKPRVFFPKPPTNLAFNGPNMYYVKRKLALMLNGICVPFIFGPGNNNISLGKKFGNAMAHRNFNYDDCISIELDLSMCETTMRGPFLVLESMIYKALGLSLYDIDYLLNHDKSHGKSMKGNLRFNMTFCRESGTANTTPGNTVVFMAVLWATLLKHGMTENDFVCLIGGDDAAIYVRRVSSPKVIAAVKSINKLGLKPEMIIHDNIYSARFFSGRMIQARVCGEDKVQFVHMPLIGRCLAKNLCCKFRGQKVEPWLRDVSIARFYEWEHIPLLREVNLAMRAQFNGVVAKNRIDMPTREIEVSKRKLVWADTTFQQLSIVYGIEERDINMAQQYIHQHFQRGPAYWIGRPLEHEVIEIMCGIDLK